MAAEQYVMDATYIVTGPTQKNVIDTPQVKEKYIGKTPDDVNYIFRADGDDFHYIHPDEISSGKYIIEPDMTGGRRKTRRRRQSNRQRKSRSIHRRRQSRRHRR